MIILGIDPGLATVGYAVIEQIETAQFDHLQSYSNLRQGYFIVDFLKLNL